MLKFIDSLQDANDRRISYKQKLSENSANLTTVVIFLISTTIISLLTFFSEEHLFYTFFDNLSIDTFLILRNATIAIIFFIELGFFIYFNNLSKDSANKMVAALLRKMKILREFKEENNKQDIIDFIEKEYNNLDRAKREICKELILDFSEKNFDEIDTEKQNLVYILTKQPN